MADERGPVREVHGLSKQFGDVQAVVNADFAVGHGELFGFLGPNGAGKTTTINMLTGLDWATLVPAIVLIAVSSTFLGLFIAVSVSEVFEAQTFSNFFRFPMIFLCGLFFPIERLPVWLQPVSYVLPLTYGADLLHAAIRQAGRLVPAVSFALLAGFCLALFAVSLRTIRWRWIA